MSFASPLHSGVRSAPRPCTHSSKKAKFSVMRSEGSAGWGFCCIKASMLCLSVCVSRSLKGASAIKCCYAVFEC